MNYNAEEVDTIRTSAFISHEQAVKLAEDWLEMRERLDDVAADRLEKD